jgi:hypothetical protein
MKISHETKRAKRIIVELVRLAGGQFPNKTSLFKAFWKAHLAYAANQPGYLSTWPMVRMPSGPGIGEFDYLLSEMLADGWLTLAETQAGQTWAITIALGPTAPPSVLPEPAVESIRQGIAEGTADSHLQSRVWREAQDGKELDIYLDLIDDEERERLEADLAVLMGKVDEAYSTSRK